MSTIAVCNTIKTFVCVAAFVVAATAPVNGHELAPEAPDGQPAVSLQQPLLAAIEAWLAFQFDLPSVEHHPRIELVPSASIAALRGGGGSEASSQQDIVAVYSDADADHLSAGGLDRDDADRALDPRS
jgi:hypothetical protein